MIRKKVCMLGDSAVGKTSLVQRFMTSTFSGKYKRTIGMMIDIKVITLEGNQMYLMLCDIYGEEDFRKVQTSYLKDASGYLLVTDGTRRSTLDTAFTLQKRVEETIGKLPFLLVCNKLDRRFPYRELPRLFRHHDIYVA